MRPLVADRWAVDGVGVGGLDDRELPLTLLPTVLLLVRFLASWERVAAVVRPPVGLVAVVEGGLSRARLWGWCGVSGTVMGLVDVPVVVTDVMTGLSMSISSAAGWSASSVVVLTLSLSISSSILLALALSRSLSLAGVWKIGSEG